METVVCRLLDQYAVLVSSMIEQVGT
jgi:hypothetical protein